MENEEDRKKYIISELLKDEKIGEFFKKLESEMIEISNKKREESTTDKEIEYEKATKYLSERDISGTGVYGEKIIGDGMRFEKVVDKGVQIEESYLTTSRDENPFVQDYERKKEEIDQLNKEIDELEKELEKAEKNILLTAFSKKHNEKIDTIKKEIKEKKDLRESKVPSDSEEKLYKLLMNLSDKEKVEILKNIKQAKQSLDEISKKETSDSHEYIDETNQGFEEVYNQALMKVLEDKNINIQEIFEKIGQTSDLSADKEAPEEESDKFLSNIVEHFINETYKDHKEKIDETLRDKLIKTVQEKLEEIKALQEKLKTLQKNKDENNIEEQKED